MTARLELDHLVVAARDLDEGRAWCEATFGAAPEPGGKHASMGTHNLVVNIAGARFPRAYLEIIAIDPDAAPPRRPRWFELDSPRLAAALARGPRLVHWAARCIDRAADRDIEAVAARWRAAGVDPGPVIDAERLSPAGLLRWRIAVPPDGRRHGDGAVPLLIAWSDVHPTDAMPARGVRLVSIGIGDPAPALDGLRDIAGVAPASSLGSEAPLVASFESPRGTVRLDVPR